MLTRRSAARHASTINLHQPSTTTYFRTISSRRSSQVGRRHRQSSSQILPTHCPYPSQRAQTPPRPTNNQPLNEIEPVAHEAVRRKPVASSIATSSMSVPSKRQRHSRPHHVHNNNPSSITMLAAPMKLAMLTLSTLLVIPSSSTVVAFQTSFNSKSNRKTQFKSFADEFYRVESTFSATNRIINKSSRAKQSSLPFSRGMNNSLQQSQLKNIASPKILSSQREIKLEMSPLNKNNDSLLPKSIQALRISNIQNIVKSDNSISDNNSNVPQVELKIQVQTLTRILAPSLLSSFIAFLLFPPLSLYLSYLINDAATFAVLSVDSSQFIQNFLTVTGLTFSILVGQTVSFLDEIIP